ncbi:MAG: hypothetical protein Q4G71_05930 [Pseudomonadota bacterium]|nr:hypothetical protein [Pseudomonadota bacterium]
MSAFAPDSSHYTMRGAYYPTDHVFTMFSDLPAARAAAEQVAALPGVGKVTLAAPDAIEQAFAERAAEVGGAPSVGREDQFMLRFVELARAGKVGVLIEVADADTEALGTLLDAAGAALAYLYRTLVIEELVDPSRRAEAAAAGKL